MAHQQDGPSNHKQQAADSNTQPVPPTHVVIDPSPGIENHKPKANDKSQATEKTMPRFARPEWVIVYVTGVYVLIAAWTLVAIFRQSRWAKRQAKLMEDQLGEMSRQTTWLIEKERPRLSIELDLYDPRQQPNIEGEYCVTGSVSIYGHAVAKVQKAEIRVSTVESTVEDSFSLYSQDVALADFMKSPDNIDIPRLIRPNSYDIGFSTPVYSGLDQPASIDDIKAVLRYRGPLRSYALYCRAKIEYSASNESWVEDVRMRLWVFADPYTEAEYGFWEEYGENQESSEDSAL